MAAEQTRHVNLVGLEVTDDAGYAAYRAGMTPLLARYGGRFGYDFVVSEVRASETRGAINRVFTILFPDRASNTAFFADPAYLAVRRAHFTAAVRNVVIIARYDEAEPATAQ